MVKTVHPVTFDKHLSGPKVDKDFRGRLPEEDIPDGEATVVLVPVVVPDTEVPVDPPGFVPDVTIPLGETTVDTTIPVGEMTVGGLTGKP